MKSIKEIEAVVNKVQSSYEGGLTKVQMRTAIVDMALDLKSAYASLKAICGWLNEKDFAEKISSDKARQAILKYVQENLPDDMQ
jgi:hypothetical protein